MPADSEKIENLLEFVLTKNKNINNLLEIYLYKTLKFLVYPLKIKNN
jgi:hypothetical protein